MARKVKYAVIDSTDNGCLVIVEDGGIATCHNNGEHLITEYYHNRIERENVGAEDFWDILGEGKMSVRDWDDKQQWDEEVVQDMLNWLYISSDIIEFVKCDLDFDNDEQVRNFIK